MSDRITVPTWTYQHFDADLSAEVPGEGYGGWHQVDLPFAPDHSALVVMHAWDCGTAEQHPGWYRAVEYLPRANRIIDDVLPPLLAAVRAAGLPVFHVVSDQDYWSHLPGHGEAIPDRPVTDTRAVADEVHEQLRKFRTARVFPGTHNLADIRTGQSRMGFPDSVAPVAGEPIASTSAELVAISRERGVNHLVYTGFALDGCLLVSPGGMVDLSRQGFLCSAVRDAVTSIENKESARDETAKQIALWRVALLYGFVYDAATLTAAVMPPHPGEIVPA